MHLRDNQSGKIFSMRRSKDRVKHLGCRIRLNTKYLPQRKLATVYKSGVILAPTQMQFEPYRVKSRPYQNNTANHRNQISGSMSTYSESSTCSRSRSRTSSISSASSATSSTGSNSPSRNRRTSTALWVSTYSASSSASTTPSTIYSVSFRSNEREPHPRHIILDHRRH